MNILTIVLLASFLVLPPLLLAFIPLLVPVVGKLLNDAFGGKVPKRAKPFVAIGVGVGAGALAHYAGLPADQAAMIAMAGGPGAVAAHECWEQVTNKRGKTKKVAQAPGPQPKD